MNIENKVVVITGGASGLGLEAARYLVSDKGAKVALFDLNEKSGKTIVTQLGEGNAIFCKTNVDEESAVERSIECTIKRFGAIHIVINAAATPTSFRILDRDGRARNLDQFLATINTNLVGTFCVLSKCVEYMANNIPENGERGVIINTSSIAAFEGQIGTSAYSASKAGINGMNIPIARELGPFGIRINSIAPGLFDTPMANLLDENVKTKLLKICEAPKRMGNPEEYAHACAFLIENGYMNGRVLRLDGASVMSSL